ncbi:MAG: hypothetical protein OHK0046_35190 [Anaerolineae bacterium]
MKKHLLWLSVVLLILVAFAVRVYRLDAVPLRGDEAYSVVHWTATPFSERWMKLWREEPAPAGAFTMYWVWIGAAGNSEFAARYLSVLGSVAGLAVVMALSKRLLERWELALLVGVLWVVHPYLIWHAQDARVYGVLSALTPFTFYALLRAADVQKRVPAGNVGWWAAYALVQTVAIYLYYLEPFWMVAQGVYILSRRRGDLVRRLLLAWVVIGILALPFFAQLYTLMFVSDYQGNAESGSFSLIFSWFMPTLLFGENTVPVWVGVLMAAVLLLGLRFVRGEVRRLLLAWIVVPLALLYGASFFSDFFRPRYVTTIIPALLIALVAIPSALGTIITVNSRLGAGSQRVRLMRRSTPWYLRAQHALPLVIAAAFVLVSAREVYDYFYRDPPKAPDWPSLMAYLHARSTERDVLIFGQPDPGIEYYYRGESDVFIAPIGWTTARNDVQLLLGTHEAVYVMSSEQTAEAAQHLQAIAQHIPGDTHPGVIQYRPWEVTRAEIAQPLEVVFGEVARLRGLTLVGDTSLLLYWEALATTETEHSVLLHVRRSLEAPPEAVLDHGVANAVISMRAWEPGALYRDPVAIPVELTPGDYTLYVGVYETGTNTLLPVADDEDGIVPVGVLRVTNQGTSGSP